MSNCRLLLFWGLSLLWFDAVWSAPVSGVRFDKRQQRIEKARAHTQFEITFYFFHYENKPIQIY